MWSWKLRSFFSDESWPSYDVIKSVHRISRYFLSGTEKKCHKVSVDHFLYNECCYNVFRLSDNHFSLSRNHSVAQWWSIGRFDKNSEFGMVLWLIINSSDRRIRVRKLSIIRVRIVKHSYRIERIFARWQQMVYDHGDHCWSTLSGKAGSESDLYPVTVKDSIKFTWWIS